MFTLLVAPISFVFFVPYIFLVLQGRNEFFDGKESFCLEMLTLYPKEGEKGKREVQEVHVGRNSSKLQVGLL